MQWEGGLINGNAEPLCLRKNCSLFNFQLKCSPLRFFWCLGSQIVLLNCAEIDRFQTNNESNHWRVHNNVAIWKLQIIIFSPWVNEYAKQLHGYNRVCVILPVATATTLFLSQLCMSQLIMDARN